MKTRQHGGANVLQFSNFRLTWQGVKPRTPPRHFYFEFCTVAALWYLLIHFLNHINYLNQSLLAILVFGTSSPRLHTTSWKSTWDPRSCLVAHYWDSVPIGSLQWSSSCLVCVSVCVCVSECVSQSDPWRPMTLKEMWMAGQHWSRLKRKMPHGE